MHRRFLLFRTAPGLASTEFALVLPLLLMLVMVVLALAIWAFSLALTAAGVPLGARQAGVYDSAAAGQATAMRVLSAAPPSAAAAGATHIGLGAPGCERAVTARLSAAPVWKTPLLDALALRLRAGSQARTWRFWAGEPTDGCE